MIEQKINEFFGDAESPASEQAGGAESRRPSSEFFHSEGCCACIFLNY